MAMMLRTLSVSGRMYLSECCERSLRAPAGTGHVASDAAWERPQVLVRVLRALEEEEEEEEKEEGEEEEEEEEGVVRITHVR